MKLDDAACMALALAQARMALDAGEVPVGAVVVRAGQVLGVGSNAPIGRHDPSAHAEMVALRAAALAVGNYRLDDCELFVTLEPCAMCAGAMLHARLKRVVFGASDPKTGAAGSVLNLFTEPRLNHQTQLQGGLLADDSAALLQGFFQRQRAHIRSNSSPLRDDALRPPDARFAQLPAYPWPAHYLSDLPALAGLRLHYLDEGARPRPFVPISTGQAQADPLCYLCLHRSPAWSYLYRHLIPIWLAAGNRVVAPDLIGFGKSDKPKKEGAHTFEWHRQVLLELVERLDLSNIVLVVQDRSDLLALSLPLADGLRYRGLLVTNLAPDTADAAYAAPFPDRGHRAALRAFAQRGQSMADADAAIARQIRDFWQPHWSGTARTASAGPDPASELPAGAAPAYFALR